jgi:ParB family chromosome partitioning protein
MNNGTLEHLDPKTLQLEGNVRDDAALTKQFLANIAENGVLVPVTAVRTPEGAIVVRTGQRRTLAAREAGLETIPVYVHDAGNRLIEQIVENDHRTGLTEAQRVRGIQQILDDGLSVTRTAKMLTIPADTVKAAKIVAGSPVALEALSACQLTLPEAAAAVEFEGDEHAMRRLIDAAGRPQFEHTLAQLREDRKLSYVEQDWRDRGFTVLSEPPPASGEYIPLTRLRKDGEPVTEVTDPAHWAVWLSQDDVLTVKETGERVDEFAVDWNTELHPDSEPGEGLLHVNAVIESTEYAPRYWCIDPEAAGLTVPEQFARSAAGFAAEPAAQKTEADKRERRKVIALNRLGEAALLVRRKFVTGLLARKTAPKGAAVFVARALATDGYLLTNYKAHEVTPELFGTVESGGLSALVDGASDARAQVITLGLVLGALESRTQKDAWREGHSSQLTGRYVGAPAYLKFLAEQGYTLAPIEEAITGAKTSDEVFEAWLIEAVK